MHQTWFLSTDYICIPSSIIQCFSKPCLVGEPRESSRLNCPFERGIQTDTICFPSLQIDLFATCLNHHLPKYVNPFPDDKAWKTDALIINWKNLMCYAFPLSTIIHQVVRKVEETDCILVMVAIYFPSQTWFPSLLKLPVELSFALPSNKWLLCQPMSKGYHSKQESLKCHVCTLSRLNNYQKVFLKSVQTWPLNLKNSPLCQYPSHISLHSQIGVRQGVPIWSLSLYML